MQHYAHFAHNSVTGFVKELTTLWNSYGSTVYAVTVQHQHDIVPISSDTIRITEFGKWITADIGEIDNCKFFVCKDSVWGGVHIDGPSPSRECAINIPIIDCNNGIMNWFSNTDHSIVVSTSRTNVHTSDYHNDIDHWNVKESMLLTQPALVRTHIWHNIDNRLNPHTRIVFSIRLKNNPKFESVHNKLSPWII